MALHPLIIKKRQQTLLAKYFISLRKLVPAQSLVSCG